MYLILRSHFTDHTKYIGKSSAHPVGPLDLLFSWCCSPFDFSNKKNVKFSDDGANIIEGEDVD